MQSAGHARHVACNATATASFHPRPVRNRPGGAGRTPDCKASQEQIVTIRAKIISLIASFIAAIVLVVAFMAYRAYQDSYQMAVSSSKSLVQSVTNYVALFFKTAGDNSLFLANLPQTAAAARNLPSHLDLGAAKMHSRGEMSLPALELDRIMEQLLKSDPSYLAVGFGDVDGGFMEYPPIEYPAGFDPRKRPWYRSGLESGDGAAASVYLNAAGTPVCSFVHTVKTQGKVAGVSYIEVSLAALSKNISGMEIGRSGRLTLVDANGIVVATRVKDALFSKVGDRKLPGLEDVYALPDGAHRLEINGNSSLVNVFSDPRGWKYIYAIDADEIFAGTYSMLTTSVVFSLIMAVAVVILGMLILRSINRPLGMLGRTSETIANGDIETRMPDKKLFSGELLHPV